MTDSNTTYKIVPSSEKYTFLVVDDEQEVVEILADTLQQKYQKAKVFTATDGQQAMTKFRNSRPSMLITDLSMPKVSGNELLSNILTMPETSSIPVIIISGLSREDRYINEIFNGRFRFLPKPFRAHELIELVEHMFQNPIKPNDRFRVDANLLNAFLTGAIQTFKKACSIETKKLSPSIRAADQASGDYSYAYSFTSKHFNGMVSVCFSLKDALALQSECEKDDKKIDDAFFDSIAQNMTTEIEESLLRAGHSIKLGAPVKNTEAGHRIKTPANANTIILPLQATTTGWKFNLELTLS